jgi:hypothetical protein
MAKLIVVTYMCSLRGSARIGSSSETSRGFPREFATTALASAFAVAHDTSAAARVALRQMASGTRLAGKESRQTLRPRLRPRDYLHTISSCSQDCLIAITLRAIVQMRHAAGRRTRSAHRPLTFAKSIALTARRRRLMPKLQTRLRLHTWHFRRHNIGSDRTRPARFLFSNSTSTRLAILPAF